MRRLNRLRPAGFPLVAALVATFLAVAGTADAGKASGEHGILRLGNRSDAQVRDGISDGYIKQSYRLAKDWSWMPMLR